jgi:hypothetical protein
MSVWKDGVEQPIDEFEVVRQTEQSSVLKGRGGTELERRCQAEITQQRVSEFVREQIEQYTAYTPNVDEQTTTREDNVHLYAANRDGEFESRLDVDRSDPVVVENGAVELVRTCHPQDAYYEGEPTGITRVTDDTFNSGVAAQFDGPGSTLRFEFEPAYDIPAKHVGVKIRAKNPTNVRLSWNGRSFVERYHGGDFDQPPEWEDVAMRYDVAIDEPIRVGETQVFEIKRLSSTGGDFILDVVALYDKRFSYTWANPGATHDGSALSGPELYPAGFDVRFEQFSTGRAVVGGQIETGGQTGGGGFERVGISNTQREDYAIASDTTVHAADFDAPGPSLAPLVTLGRYGDDAGRQELPTQGFQPQRLTSLSLAADLEDIPLVVNRSFDNPLEAVLSSVADTENAIWEFRREGGVDTVEWTYPGERVIERAPETSSYRTTKSTAKKVERAIVYGGTREITGEYHYLDTADATIDLGHDRLAQGSVTVVGAASGTRLREGWDYVVDHDAGTITPQSDGRMDAGDGFDVAYTYQTYGEFALDGSEDAPDPAVKEAAGIKSDFAARQAAKAVVTELSQPAHRGTLTVSGDEQGFGVVAALAASDLPDNVPAGVDSLHIKEIEHDTGEARIRFGSRRSLDEIVGDIERSVSSVSREV